jgi:Ca-activated chloride channel homolog
MRAYAVVALFASLISTAIPSAEGLGQRSGNPEVQSPNVIRVSTNLVMVPVSVTDAVGRPITDLGQNDFRIEEDGHAETISRMADAGQSPLQLALLFDLSGSVNPRFEFEQQAATRFLQKVWKQGDAITIVSFTEQPTIRIRNSRSLTEALQDLLKLQPTQSSTALFDTVVASARLLKSDATSDTRQAEIVLSDGEDNRSEATMAEARREIQRCDTIFYSINPGGNSIRLNDISIKGQKDLVLLARESGGTAFVSDRTADLDEIFSRIATELRAQYLLGYYSSNPSADGRFRQIAVTIPQKPDFRVRSRQGYYAVRK